MENKIIELYPKEKNTGLTIEKLKSFEGLENLTDKEAEEAIHSLRRFAQITYKFYNQYKEALNTRIAA